MPLSWPNDFIDRVVCADWKEVIGQIPDESVDLIITDPPYESLRKWDGIGTTARMGLGRKDSKSYDPDKFFPTIPNEDLPELIYQLYRVLKNNCHCYIFCDYETLKLLCTYTTAPYFTQEGLFSNEKPLVWDKVNMGMGYHYRCQYEFILMLDKGKNRRLNGLGVGDVLSFSRVAKGLVPTQKPLALCELLIK